MSVELRLVLLDRLVRMLRSEFDVARFRLNVPSSSLDGSQAQQAEQLLTTLENAGRLGELAKLLGVEAQAKPLSAQATPAGTQQAANGGSGGAGVVRLKKVSLVGIRAFGGLSLEVVEGSAARRQTLVLGRNGTCKSTLLRALALAMAPPSEAVALLEKQGGGFLAQGQARGQILLELEDFDLGRSLEVFLELERKGDGREEIAAHTGLPERPWFVCGYGTSRGVTSPQNTQGSGYKYMDAVGTLFDARASLVDTELMLRRLKDFWGTSRYEQVMVGVLKALGLDERHRLELGKGGGVFASGPEVGEQVPLGAWADGYKVTFQWLIDFYGWAMHAGAFRQGKVAGVVLVDEIEQHLHPSMQADLLPRLGEMLPEVQLVATTHSPLTAMGAGSGSLVPLHRVGDKIEMKVAPSLAGYTMEDVLTDERLFHTPPYPAELAGRLEEHKRLALVEPGSRTQAQRERLASLTQGLSPRVEDKDDKVLEEIRSLRALLQGGGKA
jgi:energy-coupling factor transporter ATP-binding protein EcfA2